MNMVDIITSLRQLIEYGVLPTARFGINIANGPPGHTPALAILRDPAGGERIAFSKEATDFAEEQERKTRRTGSSSHVEQASFVSHVNRQKKESSTIWADIANMQLVCVFDYDPAGPTARDHREHRSYYSCPLSPEWQLWTAAAGRQFSQEAFADFIEERLEDLVSGKDGESYPKPAALLEMARDLRIHQVGRFERKLNPTTGESSLVCTNENEKASTPIPSAFCIGIPLFVGGAPYRVEARLRVKIRDGFPQFSFGIHRSSEIVREAFDEIKVAVEKLTGLPVFSGTPEG